MSGPRLCALRIPNGGGNVLIDNIESDSTPVIYTRRSRFLDEELDETKDIITTTTTTTSTTNPYASVNGSTEPRCHDKYHKISMLMSDGVVAAVPNETKSESYNIGHQMRIGGDACSPDVNVGHVVQTYDDECAQRMECDQSNQKYCTNTPHITNDSIGLERNFNGLSINEHDLSQNGAYGQSLMDSNNLSEAADLKNTHNDLPDKQLQQKQHQQQQQQQGSFLHIHQFRPTNPLSLADETSMLRRQQLSRVAEWVQNNNHEACLGNPDVDYKQVTKLNNNSDEISNRSVDRISMINCNNLPINDFEAGKHSYA